MHSGVFPHSLMQWLIGLRNWFGYRWGELSSSLERRRKNWEGWRWMPKWSKAHEPLQADNSSCAATLSHMAVFNFYLPAASTCKFCYGHSSLSPVLVYCCEEWQNLTVLLQVLVGLVGLLPPHSATNPIIPQSLAFHTKSGWVCSKENVITKVAKLHLWYCV